MVGQIVVKGSGWFGFVRISVGGWKNSRMKVVKRGGRRVEQWGDVVR